MAITGVFAGEEDDAEREKESDYGDEDVHVINAWDERVGRPLSAMGRASAREQRGNRDCFRAGSGVARCERRHRRRARVRAR